MRAIAWRRRAIAAAAPLPFLAPGRGPGGGATGGPSLSVLATNVEQTMRGADAQARALLQVHADVICVIEATEATVAALRRAGLEDRYPHCSDDRDPGWFGSLILSRHPITARWTGDLGGRPGHWVDLDVAGTSVRIVAVHTQAPIFDRDVSVWHSTIAATAALASDAPPEVIDENLGRPAREGGGAEPGPPGPVVPGPVVLAGDWNATGGHRAFRRALATNGLVDAQARRGHRWWPTWPVDHPVAGLAIPPILALDHVVVSPAVAVVGLERITIPACDHRAVRAALRLPAP